MTVEVEVAYGGDSTGGSPPTAVGGDSAPPEPTPQPAPLMPRGFREELPNRRRTQSFKAHIGTAPSIYLHVDEYPDGRAGAIFITMSKTGTFTNGIMDAFSSAVSIALQYGTPLSDLADRFTGMIFEPYGLTVEDEKMTHSTSIVDWVFRTLLEEYDHDHPHAKA